MITKSTIMELIEETHVLMVDQERECGGICIDIFMGKLDMISRFMDRLSAPCFTRRDRAQAMRAIEAVIERMSHGPKKQEVETYARN